MPTLYHYKFFIFIFCRSHTLYVIPEEDAEGEDVLDAAADEGLDIVNEEGDLGLVMPRVPESIDEDLADVDNQLQSIAAALPHISR